MPSQYYSEDIPESAFTKRLDYDGSSNLIYEGWAQSRSNPASSDKAWAIRKSTYTNSNATLIQWAYGNKNQTNVWDDRASLVYA